MDKDLRLYYSGSAFVDCACNRWDTNNYSIVIETWLNKSQLNSLRIGLTPGAVGELYKILGRPTYYDQTWQSENTLRIVPVSSSVDGMRTEKTIYVKSLSDSPIPGTSGWLSVKIEGLISGSSNL